MHSKLLSSLKPILGRTRPVRSFATGRPSRGKNFVYGGVVLGAASVFGGLIYLLAKDMIFQDGLYSHLDEAVEQIQGNSSLVQQLGGLPLTVHGHTSNRGRRRPAVHRSIKDDGTRCMETSFFVEGPEATGRVHLRLVEVPDAATGQLRWKHEYFVVEVPGHPAQILVQPPQILQRQSGWRPLDRFK